MKMLVRLFFRTVRLVLGPILLFMEWVTTPKGLVRTASAQQAVDAATRQMTLYQFKTCPFCMKVRRTSKRLSLKIEKRDAQYDATNRAVLLAATGKIQVPTLRITDTDGGVTWLQGSKVITHYLQQRFSA